VACTFLKTTIARSGQLYWRIS